LISPKGVEFLKKIFEGRHATLKICLYLIFTTIAYHSIYLQSEISPLDDISVSRTKQFNISVLIYSFAVTWKPLLFIAGFSALKFVDKKKERLDLSWQIAVLFIVFFILKPSGYLPLYKYFGEIPVRDTLAQLVDQTILIPDIKVFQTPNPMIHFATIHFQSWISLLTISLLLPQFIHLKDIGIGKIQKPAEIFKQTPVIWLYFIAIILITLIKRRFIFSEPVKLLSFFYFVFLRALFEEICFRGILQTCFLNMFKKLKLKMRYAGMIAILFSAVFFVLYHGPLLRIENPYFIFFFGLLTGRIFYKTRSIFPGLMVHTAVNLALLKI
jgi:membrane protease YdiL (CAAX protease family)